MNKFCEQTVALAANFFTCRASRQGSLTFRTVPLLLTKLLHPRAKPAGVVRACSSGLRVALLGNIANNAFNMTNILRQHGIFAQLIDDGTNTFAFSRPAW